MGGGIKLRVGAASQVLWYSHITLTQHTATAQSQHIVTTHRLSTRPQHNHNKQSNHTATAHSGHSTRSQHTHSSGQGSLLRRGRRRPSSPNLGTVGGAEGNGRERQRDREREGGWGGSFRFTSSARILKTGRYGGETHAAAYGWR